MADFALLGLMGAGLVGLTYQSERYSKTRQQQWMETAYKMGAEDKAHRTGAIPPMPVREYIYTDAFARGRFLPTGRTVYHAGGQKRVELHHPITGQLVYAEEGHQGGGQGL